MPTFFHLLTVVTSSRSLSSNSRIFRLALLSATLTLTLMAAWGFNSVEGANQNILSASTTWSRACGPYILEADLLIPAGFTLTIKPGTEVLFGPGTSLIIEGAIRAQGTPEAPILFSSASQEPSPGDWGNLRFVTADTTLSYDEEGNFIRGSRLEHCIVEYGGRPRRGTPKEFLGGAIHCRKSSPYLCHLIVRRNHSLQGGGLYCHEFASPYVTNSLFLDNEADESGGGIACFFYSNAVVQDNIFNANRADEQGGGIYFSFSSPQIINNIIQNNTAEVHGGGLHGSNTVTGAVSRVRHNVLLSNRAKYQSNGIYLTAKIETIFQENCFLAGEGYDVYVQALEKDLDLGGNYFGPTSWKSLEARIYDGYDDPAQKSVLTSPVLESPPTELPNAPGEVSSFELFGDEAFSTDWPFPLCDEAPLYLEARALDRNPYHADWLPVRLHSSASDPGGIVVLAWETGPSTGIFRLRGQVSTASGPEDAAIQAHPGENVFCSIEGEMGFEVSRPVDTPQSYIVALRMPEEADSFHVVDHRPILLWTIRDICVRQQQSYQMQLSRRVPFAAPPIWDSGELMGSITRTALPDPPLEDGVIYSLRLRTFNSKGWSGWAEMALRMNSLPTVPVPTSPQNGLIVQQVRPDVLLKASTDAEGDSILYELQLCPDAQFQNLLAIDSEVKASGKAVRWTVPDDLVDNGEYYWRARSRDPFETGPWTPAGQFWVNLVEESPLPFGLLEPPSGGEIYQLQPVFSWEPSSDPDPLSWIQYRLSISRDAGFLEAATVILETDSTFVEYPRELKNAQTYYWKVLAVDNTGRTTLCDQVGSFFVNTTPSVPELIGPLAGEELKPAEMIAWHSSQDPDPSDTLEYHLQITRDDFAAPMLEEVRSDAGIPLDSLKGYSLLLDNTEYRFRVRAEDQHGISSEWSEVVGLFFFNKTNDPPGPVAEPITPGSGVVTDPQPVLQWGAASDPDRSDPPQSLTYLIQFDPDGDFSGDVSEVNVEAGSTRVTVPGLADNQVWFYRICAQDDEGTTSAWSPMKRFVLNTQNDPPEPFALTGPGNGVETHKLSGLRFTWEATRDTDPGDSVRYWFHLVRAADQTQVCDPQPTEETAWQLNVPLDNETEYLWWVQAEDLVGVRTPSSEIFNFRVNTTPSVPQPLPIANDIVTGGETFRWLPSSDPDPADEMTYEFRIVPAEGVGEALIQLKDISSEKALSGIAIASLNELSAIPDNHRYAFQVRARDPHQAISDWSDPADFFLDLVNDPPGVPGLIEPADELIQKTDVTVRWSQAFDPDPSDQPVTLSYLLQAVPGLDFSGDDVRNYAQPAGSLSLVGLHLADNQLWSLRIRTEDGRGGLSDWSQPLTLLVNVAEDPPSPPQILGPKAGSVFLASKPVELFWSASQDPDYNASVSYEVRCWPEDEPDDIQIHQTGEKTSLVLEGLEGDRDYHWQVLATDDTGLESHSQISSFHMKGPGLPPQSLNLPSLPDSKDEEEKIGQVEQ